MCFQSNLTKLVWSTFSFSSFLLAIDKYYLWIKCINGTSFAIRFWKYWNYVIFEHLQKFFCFDQNRTFKVVIKLIKVEQCINVLKSSALCLTHSAFKFRFFAFSALFAVTNHLIRCKHIYELVVHCTTISKHTAHDAFAKRFLTKSKDKHDKYLKWKMQLWSTQTFLYAKATTHSLLTFKYSFVQCIRRNFKVCHEKTHSNSKQSGTLSCQIFHVILTRVFE